MPDAATRAPDAPTEPTALPAVDRPFGSLVVGVRSEAIWLLAGEEAPRVLAHGTFPALSPDGCWVAFGRSPWEQWVAGVSDGKAKRLFSALESLGGIVYGMGWSPDASGLAVTTGGSAKIPYLRTAIERRSRVPVEVLDPFRRVLFDERQFSVEVLKNQAPQATVSLGLALRRQKEKI